MTGRWTHANANEVDVGQVWRVNKTERGNTEGKQDGRNTGEQEDITAK